LNLDIHYSSKDHTWATPPGLFAELDHEFGFTLDVCALPHNTKCARYFSPEQDGLAQDWGGEVCWCNPPYGGQIGKWLAKGREEAMKGATVVFLIPARTDTVWFHKHVLGKGEIRFLKGRVKFVGAKFNAPFPSMVVVYRPGGQPPAGEVGGAVQMRMEMEA
jgi:phage N-6-adenine-methyltransferase